MGGIETPTSLNHPPAPPTLFNATAESLQAETKRLLEGAKKVQDAVVANVSPETATFANVLLPLVQEENSRLYERQLIEFYGNVSTNEAVRDASQEAEELFSQFDTETALRDDLFALIAAVRDKSEHLDTESQRLVEKSLLDFERNGLALPEEGRIRLRELNKALKEVTQDYMKTYRTNKPELWFTPDELDGVKKDFVQDLEKGEGANEGKLRLILDEMRYLDVMSAAHRRETRREVYYAYANGCKDNLPRLEKIIVLRQEKAQLLGYRNFATFRMADKMEKSPERLQAFHDDLFRQSSPARDARIAKWKQMKREDLKARGEEDDGKFYAWDRSYYWLQAWSKDHDLDARSVEEYFSLDETTTRMLKIYEKVFSMAIVELDRADRDKITNGSGKYSVWHEDVRMFAVWDSSDANGRESNFLGYLYMDMHPRDGKMGGFADLPVRPAYTDVDGSRKYTATALICNFNKPTTTTPCLLPINQVALLFHELGHGIHDLVAKTKFARFHGASTAGDFNEAPSQMLENWPWHSETLRSLSKHYSNLSPEYLQAWQNGVADGDKATRLDTIPEDVAQKLTESKKTREMNKCLSLLDQGTFEIAINEPETPDGAKSIDTTKLRYAIECKTFGLDLPDTLAPIHVTTPMTISSEGFYIYLASWVYAQDLFYTGFKADPLDQKQGLRYREKVIGKGSSEDEMKMLTDFLGRPPTLEALFATIGLDDHSKNGAA